MECLGLFRQVMMDIAVSLSYGYRLSAVRKWVLGFEDPLCTAISDFPKRGIVVNFASLARVPLFCLTSLHLSVVLSPHGSGPSSVVSPTPDGDNFATLIRLSL
jgi:hypothetical protein